MPHLALVRQTTKPQHHWPEINVVQKPLFPIGAEIYAAVPSSHRSTRGRKHIHLNYYPGVVKNYSLKKDEDYGHGPLILYDVLFDDGTTAHGVMDCHVYCREDYKLLTSKWKGGIERARDDASRDPWASKMGWFTVKIDGVKRAFARLVEALRAYDAQVVRIHGPNTVHEDLNLPPEWAWLKW